MNERELFEKAIRENLAPDHADDALEMEGDYYAEYATSLAWSMWREGRRFAPTEGAVAWPVPLSIETNYEVGQTVELIFESDEDAETFSRLYSEHMGDAAPSPEAPAVDALTTGALEDDMVEYLYDLARGYTREKFAFHLQSLFNGRAHPASEPKALTRNKLHTLLIRHAVSFAEWDDGSLEYVNFGQYGFEAFFSELLRATDRANAPSSEEES